MQNAQIIIWSCLFMAMSKAHIRASNKYNVENYKKLQAFIKPADFELIDNFCKENKISKAELIVKSCKLYIGSELMNKNK